MIIGGAWGISFTYSNVVQESITTSKNASIPNTLVRGPFTLKAQADVIRKHTLKATNGKTYAQMPSKVPQLDDSGNQILDTDGNPVMVSNDERNIWITATTLMTALNLGIVTYAFSGLIIFFGLVSIWTGITFYILSKKQ